VRILFYHASMEWTGGTRAFAALARGLSERGHMVTFACPAESPAEQRLDFGVYEVLGLAAGASPVVTVQRLRRALRERFIQVVCVHTETEQITAAAAARMAERAAVLRRVPSGGCFTLGAAARASMRLTATGFLLATEDDLRRAPAASSGRLPAAVVPLGVNAARYEGLRAASLSSVAAPTTARALVCVYDPPGRAAAANVVRVMGLLAPRHPDLHLVFVGPGSDNEEFRMHAAALHILPRVSFLGPRDDALSVLALAELGWVVAQGDDGAYGALDLSGCRVPVIAERGSTAQPYVPDGITGVILSPGDSHDAAAVIARLLAHGDQRAAMGSAGHARVVRDQSEAAMLDAFERAMLAAGDRTRW